MMRCSFKFLLAFALLCGITASSANATITTTPRQPVDYTTILRREWVPPFQLFAMQVSIMMEAQVEAIGMFLDAKHQLETQRLFQEKVAEAHRDYQPSEQMCTFGTFTRDLATTEHMTGVTRNAIIQHMQQRAVSNGDSYGNSPVSDSLSRILRFRRTFCNPGDSAMGLVALCPQATPVAMRNRDINYTVTLDQPLSLDVDLSNNVGTQDEEAVFALLDNLFAHNQMQHMPENLMGEQKFQYHYSNLRSILAMRSVARNSFANIIAMKTAGPATINQSTGPYLRALLREFGMSPADITAQLGENPSYYAQMELLTKKMYQNPVFYTNLYDKPANVQRIRAAMKAIKLMQDRDIQASFQRREMLMSMILEARLRNASKKVYSETEGALFDEAPLITPTP